jgi:hypothetical protein
MPDVIGVDASVSFSNSPGFLDQRFHSGGGRVRVVEQSGDRDIEAFGDADQTPGNDRLLAGEGVEGISTNSSLTKELRRVYASAAAQRFDLFGRESHVGECTILWY